MRQLRRWLIGTLVAGSLAVGALFAWGRAVWVPFIEEERKPFRLIAVGTTEASVVEKLGAPAKKYEADTAPHDYYVSGYQRKDRAISGSVLIYVRGDIIAYVYLDREGRVEEVFVGGS